MFTASILFFVIKTIFYQSPWCRRYLNKPFKYFLWNIYVGILGLISISRMFFACHFFHQCVFGSCFGITISHILQKPKVNRFLTELGRIKAFMLGMAIVIFSISIYFAHYVIAQDPLWTVKKVIIWFAFKQKKKRMRFFQLINYLVCFFLLKLGFQLVQRSILYQTRNQYNLFVGS